MALKLTDWSSIAEIVGSIAIVVSLIFVGTEINRNTLSNQASTFQSVSDSLTEFTLTLASDPDLGQLYTRGLTNLSGLSPDERERFYMLLTTIGRRLESAYIQRQSGVLLQSQWAGFGSVCKGVLRSPGAIEWLEQKPTNFSPEFTEFLENDCE